jgi:hypothetical protein
VTEFEVADAQGTPDARAILDVLLGTIVETVWLLDAEARHRGTPRAICLMDQHKTLSGKVMASIGYTMWSRFQSGFGKDLDRSAKDKMPVAMGVLQELREAYPCKATE